MMSDSGVHGSVKYLIDVGMYQLLYIEQLIMFFYLMTLLAEI